MWASSLVVRGFEPLRLVNESAVRDSSQRIPALIHSAVSSRDSFSLEDATSVVATLHRLILNSESSLLDEVLATHFGLRAPRSFSISELEGLLEDYMLRWIMGDVARGYRVARMSHDQLRKSIPGWDEALYFAKGQIKAFDYERQHRPAGRRWRGLLDQLFSLEDASIIVGSITRSFAWFHKSDCDSLEANLVTLDTTGTGRVPLSKFYAAGKTVDWRLGESETHLRDLGALDETSPWRGKQVLIPNYLQAASNCIVSTPDYQICCASRCDTVLSEIEMAVGGPTGVPDEILEVVQLMPGIEGEELLVVPDVLRVRLEEISSKGGVRLHGRLFAQWLHYVFPRDCAFPHKAGTVSALERVSVSVAKATEKEIEDHVSGANWSDYDPEGTEWMTQWSAEEELMEGMESESAMLQLIVGGVLLLLAGVSIGHPSRRAPCEEALHEEPASAHLV
eukprot:CAMPEP_0194511226 /NCGR_PEP_ID=MMETSP0253-20130528/42831_1 /TAXON_ID=2966 /ORGANISM="Noctiluca scintillans" /LENGTH=450 /DNA_ID=CAMNT_0039354541 /DNA_START=272 /DNA_END=1624 /DNA_ORIENTATION=-